MQKKPEGYSQADWDELSQADRDCIKNLENEESNELHLDEAMGNIFSNMTGN